MDGQSTWTPGPYTSALPNTTQLPPPIQHGGPMLFAHPPPSDVLPGKEQDTIGDTSIGTMMDVDTSMRAHEHDHTESRDIDMWSDSPAKPIRGHTDPNTPAEEEGSNGGNTSQSATQAKPTLLSSILRPINANAVKRVEKQRSKTQQRRQGDRAASAGSGSVNRGALVLRAAEGEDEDLLSEDGDSEDVSDEEGNFNDVSIHSTRTHSASYSIIFSPHPEHTTKFNSSTPEPPSSTSTTRRSFLLLQPG
jgi:hypothetical protein